MKSTKPEQIVVSDFDPKQVQFRNDEEAKTFNPLYEYIDVYRPLLLKTDEFYRNCAKIITQNAEKNDRSWLGIKMTPICIEQFEHKHCLKQSKI